MDGILCLPGEGEAVFDEERRTLRVLVDREELTVTWFRYAAGEEGPDPHVHRRHTDAFYVLEGDLTFEIGCERQIFSVSAGACGMIAASPNSTPV